MVSLTVLYVCLCERSEAISQLNKIATPDMAGLAMTSYLCDTTLATCKTIIDSIMKQNGNKSKSRINKAEAEMET